MAVYEVYWFSCFEEWSHCGLEYMKGKGENT